MNVTLKEQRICQQCGKVYQCAPLWRPRNCPSCQGLRIAGYQHREAASTDDTARALAALRTLVDVMDPLDERAQRCIMAWLHTRYEKEWP